MKCPVDEAVLTITERSGVEIDYCPQCRGVWLDRGELDKIIDRNEGATNPGRQPQDRSGDGGRSDDSYGKNHGYDQPYGKRKKRESFLGDLFDF